MVRPRWTRGLGAGSVVVALATLVPACSPNSPDGPPGAVAGADPSAVTGGFTTYVADNRDATSERWYAVRTPDGREIRLDFDKPPLTISGAQVRVQGDVAGERLHVTNMEELQPQQIAAAG